MPGLPHVFLCLEPYQAAAMQHGDDVLPAGSPPRSGSGDSTHPSFAARLFARQIPFFPGRSSLALPHGFCYTSAEFSGQLCGAIELQVMGIEQQRLHGNDLRQR